MRRRQPHSTQRRAGVLVAAMIALVWINLTIVSAITAGDDDARTAHWRLDALRATAAAASAIRIVDRMYETDPDEPAQGTVTLSNGQSVEIESSFGAPPESPGTLRVRAVVRMTSAMAERTR